MINFFHISVFTGRKKTGRMKQVVLTTQLKISSVKEKELDKKGQIKHDG